MTLQCKLESACSSTPHNAMVSVLQQDQWAGEPAEQQPHLSAVAAMGRDNECTMFEPGLSGHLLRGGHEATQVRNMVIEILF
ncbi:lactase B [Aspergillus luchuensis]|uniref:Lactase B n=1 Tax=Aspergillus kawachii TaxID=1069201 RepID=A0A146F9U4_ASPKA|nr:lactase B [Aspergillus luchuensis]